MITFLSRLFRRKPNQRVVELIESIRSSPATLSYAKNGVPMIYLASGWGVASVGGRLVSIPEISTTKREEREICDAISDRVVELQKKIFKEGGSR